MLSLKTGNQQSRSRYWTDTVSGEAKQDLRRWGSYIRARIYLHAQPSCVLGNMVEYGAWIRSGYTNPVDPIIDHRIEQTRKVLVFMPEELFSTVFMQYVMDCEPRFRYRRLKLTREAYFYRLGKAVQFYDAYKDTNFS
jgi:hypothetical protein